MLVTDYMVAQQYLTVLRTLFAQNSNAQVTLLPTKTIKSIQQIAQEITKQKKSEDFFCFPYQFM